jgi:amino acid transporter
LSAPNTPRSDLRKNALDFVHAVAIGVAGTAPSYTIAVSTAVLVGAVGALAPASLLYCGLIMVGITFAFANLNRVYPDSGASYEWVGRVFNRDLGFITGWTVLVSSALFMVSATIPAATATLLLIAPEAAGSKLPVIAVSACWLVAVSAVLVRGVRLTGIVQTVMTAIEIVVLAGLTLTALVRYGREALGQLSWTALMPTAFSPDSFSAGAVIALFFFWGWDVTLNVSEETRDSRRTPGRAAAFAMLIIVSAFMSFAVVTLAVLSQPEIQASGTNVIFAVAEKLVPRPWSYLAVLAVMLSSVGSLEACVLTFARTMFAKSRAGDMHPRWSRVHERWGTPHLATYMITALSLLLLVLSLAFPDIDALLKASINAIGLEVAFYYGLAALACAWHFHASTARSARMLVLTVAWPLLSAVVLLAVAVLAARSMDATTLVIGIGGIAIGLVPLAWLRKGGRRAIHPITPPER